MAEHEDDSTVNAKKRLADEKKLSDRSRAEYAERMKGKPTPTQEENDLAALGAHIAHHEEDGSDPDPHGQTVPDQHGQTRQLEADKSKPASYQTRTAAPRTSTNE
jgi:hypothetical protein